MIMHSTVTKYVSKKTSQYIRHQVFKSLYGLQDITFELCAIQTGIIEFNNYLVIFTCDDMMI